MKVKQPLNRQLDLFTQIEWHDSELVVFIQEFLHANLKILNSSRASSVSRSEIMDWVFSDDNKGLSFVLCCTALGLDYQEVRHLLRKKIKLI